MLAAPTLELLRKNIVAASNVSHMDTFLALSETDRYSALLAQELLHPVWTLANVQPTEGSFVYALGNKTNICVGASRLLHQACNDARLAMVGSKAPAHGRWQCPRAADASPA